MDIGQGNTSADNQAPKIEHKPFARPKKKRRRTLPSKPTVIAVRPNPSHYVLNFVDGDRPERSLLSIVLSNKRAVSLLGLPGSGKTVILRAVAYHPSVTSTFRDGIFFIQMHKRPSVSVFFEYLLEVVDKLGAVIPSEEVRRLAKQDNQDQIKAIDKILSAVRDKRFLLIVDHVTENMPELYKIVSQMLEIAPRGRQFTMVCSTRSHDVAKMFSNATIVEVMLHDSTGDTSRNILCSHAGFERPQIDELCCQKDNSIIPVLKKCSGLPLALAVAGGAVKRLLEPNKPPKVRDIIWSHYRAYLNNNFDQFGNISGLFSSLAACVDSIRTDKDWRTSLSVWDVFCSLATIRDGVWVPYPILQRLWDIRKKDDVIGVVRPLSRQCLLQRERRGSAVGVVISNIILDYCRHEAKLRNSLQASHLRLLSSYTEHGGMIGGRSRTELVEEGQYLKENVDYHMTQSLLNADNVESQRIQALINPAYHIINQTFLDANTKQNSIGKTIQPTLPSVHSGNISLDKNQNLQSGASSTANFNTSTTVTGDTVSPTLSNVNQITGPHQPGTRTVYFVTE